MARSASTPSQRAVEVAIHPKALLPPECSGSMTVKLIRYSIRSPSEVQELYTLERDTGSSNITAGEMTTPTPRSV